MVANKYLPRLIFLACLSFTPLKKLTSSGKVAFNIWMSGCFIAEKLPGL
jgi:hypothetical protein